MVVNLVANVIYVTYLSNEKMKHLPFAKLTFMDENIKIVKFLYRFMIMKLTCTHVYKHISTIIYWHVQIDNSPTWCDISLPRNSRLTQ